ncbi:MAG: glycosyltransferase family 4 protein [Prevotellaceae bacterium]|jgi:glycosyltransferase involved in cell wall biosynthesis|nr:glycosyltransferase family 4 protein [Prevotellaceae bacterium]
MKILYYCDEYPPARNGGIGSVTKTVAECLAARGHQVFVVGLSPVEVYLPHFSEINGVKIYRLQKNENRFFDKLFQLFDKNYKIKKSLKRTHNFIENLINKEKIDIIEIPDYKEEICFELTKTIKWKKYKISTICRIHGSTTFVHQLFNGEVKPYIFENDRLHISRCNKISAVSRYSADWVKENFNIDKPLDVIYNPIETNYFENIKPYPKDKNILYFGKLSKLKGFYSLVEAYKIVAEQENESKLVIVGAKNEDEIENAKKLFPEQMQNRIIFKPFMNKSELQTEIDNAYLCALPSYAENFSMAALEVLARGRLLIYTSRCSGAELITDGENGYLVEPNNFTNFAEKILYAFNNREKMEKIAKNGYEFCKKRFSTETIIPQMEKYYKQVIGNK